MYFSLVTKHPFQDGGFFNAFIHALYVLQQHHNGRRNGFKNHQVIEDVNKFSPQLIVDEKIYLGSLPAHGSISIKDGSDFIERLVEYASVRVNLAEKKKKKKK